MSAARTPCEEMLAFVAVLESVGVTHTDVTMLSLDKGQLDGKKIGSEKVRFESGLSASVLRQRLPGMIADADRHECSVVVSHPRAGGVKLIQCDDVKGDVLARLWPVSFMVLETSPGNNQAWVAVLEDEAISGDYYRRLRKGVGSDRSASEATRTPGSHNFKSKYGPDYPMIRLLHAVPGKIATGTELEQTGLLAEQFAKETVPRAGLPARSEGQKFPDYLECVRYGEQRGDRDLADHRFAWIAAARGFSLDEIAAELMRLSPKAAEQRDPERYCQRKAEAGAEYASRYRASRAVEKPLERPKTLLKAEVRLPGPAKALLAQTGQVETSLARGAASLPKQRRDGMFASEGARGAKTFVICSTREDAVALHGATGIPVVSIALEAFPPDMQLRCALRRVIIAARQDKLGDALARRIIETCTLSTLQLLPWPQTGVDEQTLRRLFADFVHRPVPAEAPETGELEAAPGDAIALLDYAVHCLGEHPATTEQFEFAA